MFFILLYLYIYFVTEEHVTRPVQRESSRNLIFAKDLKKTFDLSVEVNESYSYNISNAALIRGGGWHLPLAPAKQHFHIFNNLRGLVCMFAFFLGGGGGEVFWFQLFRVQGNKKTIMCLVASEIQNFEK